MGPDILETVKNLGFTEYEAKAYLALLEKAPLSGYAVSLNSGVPRSKIYEVLGGMAQRGDVIVSPDATPLYVPLPPGELIARKKTETERRFEAAGEALERYAVSSRHREGIWNITGRDAILGRVAEGIRRAKRRVLLEIWKDDAGVLEDVLREASGRGVEVVVVSYGPLDFSFATVYLHDISEQITSEYGGRWVVFGADDCEVVAGIVSLGDDSRAAWTSHPGLVMPITEVIVHDIYIMEIMREFRGELEAKFGPSLTDLRRKFLLDAGERKGYLSAQTEPPAE